MRFNQQEKYEIIRLVEVSFLQILLKTGIVGFILYITIIVSAIFKALSKSKNLVGQ